MRIPDPLAEKTDVCRRGTAARPIHTCTRVAPIDVGTPQRRGRYSVRGRQHGSKRTAHTATAALEHMRVDLGRPDVGVPELLLHGANVRTALQQVRRERMAQRMAARGPFAKLSRLLHSQEPRQLAFAAELGRCALSVRTSDGK